MRQAFKYVPESEDLKQARQIDANAYKEFLEDMDTDMRWNSPPNLRWSDMYDAPEPA